MDDTTGLTERVARLEDLLAIQQLFVEYGRAVDRADHDAYAALFAEDGEVDLGAHGKARGRAAIRELIARSSGPPGTSLRIVSNPQVHLDGDRATAEAMFTVVVGDAGGQPQIASVGRHADDLVREDGRWRFARRAAHVEFPPPG